MPNLKYLQWLRTLLFCFLSIGIYYPAYHLMVTWWQRDDYNYCYLIPFVSVYLLWEKRNRFISLPSIPAWKGLILFVPGIIFFWLGELGGEYYTLYLSSWLVLVGLIWMHTGWNKLKVIGFPLFFIVTMFPPPNFIYNNLSLKLKLISSQISVATLQAVGISAYREGNVIDLGFTILQVVDACSGMRYLISMIVLSMLLAYFFKARPWKKIFLVLSSIPISILVNSLRIASVALLYPVMGIKAAEGFFHDFSGWLIFMVSAGLLLPEMWLLQKIGKAPANSTIKTIPEPGVDNTDKHVKNAVRATGPFHLQFIVAVVLLAGTLALYQGIDFREKTPINKSFDSFPMQVADWSGKRESMEQRFIDTLDFKDYMIANYKTPTGKRVNFYVAYYESQGKGESIHSPESCFPGSGWVFKHSGTTSVPLVNRNLIEIKVNRALMQKGDRRQLSYFWFPQRDRILNNIYQLKFYNFWDALTRQRTDGALVRLITPMEGPESVQAAEQRLQEFTRAIVPLLDQYLPK